MQELHGQRVADGLAVGMAVFIEPKALHIPATKINSEQVEAERQSLLQALRDCEAELGAMLTPGITNDGEKEILNTHIEILRDPELHKNLLEAIDHDHWTAAKAVDEIFTATTRFFEGLDNEMFSHRAADYNDISTRLLRKLLGLESEDFSALGVEYIPIFTKISPSQVSKLHRQGVRAFIADTCSNTSHAAIISRALGIAVVNGVHEIRSYVKEGDMLIIDAEAAKVIVDPDDEMLEYYAQKLQVEELIKQKQEKLKATDAVTLDGQRVSIYVNMGLPEELPGIKELGCDGIGLFRTEFIYLSRNSLPNEDEQFEIYSKVVSEMAPLPVTIRTFDLGGDKLLHLIPSPHEQNPYLGSRGIRFSLAHPELFKTQLRAIIRASAFGKVKVMFPMVIDVDDFKEARSILVSCMNDLYAEGHKYDSEIPIGCMIEIPSAALSSDALAKECDFFSIGTNDLAQYTLAVDRNCDNVSRYYITHHPSVLKLIRITVDNAAKHGVPVSLCGEMASQPEYVPLLIGMGIKELSVNSSSHYGVKSVVQNCDAKLNTIMKNFDFSTSLLQVDELVYRTLKPYYSSPGRY